MLQYGSGEEWEGEKVSGTFFGSQDGDQILARFEGTGASLGASDLTEQYLRTTAVDQILAEEVVVRFLRLCRRWDGKKATVEWFLEKKA